MNNKNLPPHPKPAGFLKKFLTDFFSSTSTPEVNQFKKYIRYTVVLFLFFIFVFSVSLVFILKSSEIHQLTDFRGKDILFAIKELQKNDLKINLFEKIDVNTPKYKVISQDPAPGEMVKTGRTVSVVVSVGDQFTTMPNFISNQYDEARKSIFSLFAGYRSLPNVIKINRYSTFPEGLVVSQTPKEGELFSYDQDVILVVSQGLVDKAIEIVNYINQPFRDVERELLNQGLKVKARYYLTAKRNNSGKIVKQSVKPKNFMVPGEEISFEVGLYSETKISNQGGSVELVRFYSLQVPFKASSYRENNDALEALKINSSNALVNSEISSDSTNKKTSVGKVEPADSEEPSPQGNPLRVVKLVVEDSLGRQVVLEEEIPSGKYVDLPYKTIGSGTLSVYIDEILFETVNF